MSFALGLMLGAAQFAQGAGFADLAAIDRQVEAFTGAPIGAPGGAITPVDRRMRLRSCGAPLAISWYGLRRNSLQVQCPEANGWRIFVQLASAPVAAAAAAPEPPAVSRGDAVTISVQGEGFSVSQPGEALDAGPVGAWIRVRPVRSVAAGPKGDTLRAQIARPGMVVIPLP